jgi:hypothetical protein
MIGRKPLSGDVLEFPHLRDDYALNSYDIGLPRYYVIEDVGRASEGFSITWWPHLYRLKLKKITASQQFADLLNQPALLSDGTPTNSTVGSLLSTAAKENLINDAVIAEAEANAPLSGYETRQFYTLAVDPTTGLPILKTADETDINASATTEDASETSGKPKRSGYTGYLLGDGTPPNGAEFGHGISFPNDPFNGDYFLRTDFLPNRLFRYDGLMWIKVEDVQRMTMTNDDPTRPIVNSRQTLKTSFINNTNITGSIEVGYDVFVANSSSIGSVLTNINYVAGMVATVYILDVAVTTVVSNGTGGKALITFDRQASTGDTIQWKLFTASVPQRQSLSKALKPKADL